MTEQGQLPLILESVEVERVPSRFDIRGHRGAPPQYRLTIRGKNFVLGAYTWGIRVGETQLLYPHVHADHQALSAFLMRLPKEGEKITVYYGDRLIGEFSEPFRQSLVKRVSVRRRGGR